MGTVTNLAFDTDVVAVAAAAAAAPGIAPKPSLGMAGIVDF